MACSGYGFSVVGDILRLVTRTTFNLVTRTEIKLVPVTDFDLVPELAKIIVSGDDAYKENSTQNQ